MTAMTVEEFVKEFSSLFCTTERPLLAKPEKLVDIYAGKIPDFDAVMSNVERSIEIANIYGKVRREFHYQDDFMLKGLSIDVSSTYRTPDFLTGDEPYETAIFAGEEGQYLLPMRFRSARRQRDLHQYLCGVLVSLGAQRVACVMGSREPGFEPTDFMELWSAPSHTS